MPGPGRIHVETVCVGADVVARAARSPSQRRLAGAHGRLGGVNAGKAVGAIDVRRSTVLVGAGEGVGLARGSAIVGAVRAAAGKARCALAVGACPSVAAARGAERTARRADAAAARGVLRPASRVTRALAEAVDTGEVGIARPTDRREGDPKILAFGRWGEGAALEDEDIRPNGKARVDHV